MAGEAIPIYNPQELTLDNINGLVAQEDFTPFGLYNDQEEFKEDAIKVTKFCAYRLGYPITEIELEPRNFYACFEDAVNTYGAEVHQYKVRENYFNLEGTERNDEDNLDDKVVNPTLNRVVKFSADFATEAMAGGNIDLYRDYFEIYEGVQEYDFNDWVEEKRALRDEYLASVDGNVNNLSEEKQAFVKRHEGIEKGIEIRTLYYKQPPAIQRYFDPFAGQGSGIQALQDIFGYGQFSPGINFLLLPISFDVALLQAIEFNDQIRRSSYTYDLVGTKLRIFPIPTRSGEYFFEYYKNADRSSTLITSPENDQKIITNISNVPYDVISYTDINSIGRQWIRSYTLAGVKELLAYVRGKYSTIPVPGSEATLNQADLLADARLEKEELIESLRDTLEQSSRQMQLEQRAKESESHRAILNDLPLPIWRI